MRTFAIYTLGCKVNQYESQQIRELLERFGLNQLDTVHAPKLDNCGAKTPDLIVINTCCVTQSASAKSRQYIRRAQNLSPNAYIVVAGCMPIASNGELNNITGKNIRLIKSRNNLTATLYNHVRSQKTTSESPGFLGRLETSIKPKKSPKIKYKNDSAYPDELGLISSFKGHTRAFLKIQGGCDGYCSYCIIPKTRPFVHSKPIEDVLQEAQALVESGHREIVLTGIFLGAFGQQTVRRKKWPDNTNSQLAELLDKLAEIPNLARIRLSSLEPADVTERLLDVFCSHRNIMPHLHLSLQSGSDAVLKRMCRQYTIGEFRDKISLVKSRLDRPALTADIIVGFAGERDCDFEATAELAKESGFAKMHVFPFSSRAGTAAASMDGPVNKRVVKERAQKLRDLDIELGWQFRQQFIGESVQILVENNNGTPSGRSERYFSVYLDKTTSKVQKGELVKVKLIKNNKNGMIGQLGGKEKR